MFDITIQGRGFDDLNKLARKLQNLDRPLGEVGAYLERKAIQRFNTETAPDGRKWAKLSPSTIATKKSLGKSSRILTSDAQMVGSIAFKVSGNAVTIKPSVDYAIFHQVGTKPHKIKPKEKKVLAFMTPGGMAFAKEVNHPGIPARPFMGFEADDPERIAQIIADYLGS